MKTAIDIANAISQLWPIFVAVATWIARNYVRDAAKAAMTRRVIDVATVMVGAADKTVRQLRDPTKPGTWDKAAEQDVKDGVVTSVRRVLGDEYDHLALMFVGGDRAKIEAGRQRVADLIEAAIEAAVTAVKLQRGGAQ